MKKYWVYLKYVLEHKKNVFIECCKAGLLVHAFTHDLSKFCLTEFIGFANYDFNGENSKVDTQRFNKAWQHHKDRNKHHWDYWSERNLEMPNKYVNQMICDWKAMGRKFGNTVQEFYLKNYDKMELAHGVRLSIETKLGLQFFHCCECDQVYWMTCREIIEDAIKIKKNRPQRYSDELTLEWIDKIDSEFGIDMLSLLGYKREDVEK